MGETHINATVYGPLSTKEYNFLVDTGSSFIGLPLAEIRELGLTPIPEGRVPVMTGEGLVERDTYVALGILCSRGFAGVVISAPVPLIGFVLLEQLRFKVNPVTHAVEDVPEDEPHAPWLL